MRISRYKDIDMILESELKVKNPLTTLVVNIGDKTFYNREAYKTFVEVVEEISNIVGVDKFIEDNCGKIIKGGVIIGLKKEDFTTTAGNSSGLKQAKNFLVNTHSSTEAKKNRLDYLLNLYEINGSVSIRKRIDGFESDIDDESDIDNESDIDLENNERVELLIVNPFGGESTKNSDKESSAICVLGKSGAGKTYRIEKTLEMENHVAEIIIPSSSTTNLLVQYTKGEYVLSRLGKFILDANSDRSRCYTVVFDECHKYIDMINDELLQCISTKRNNGLRFISLDTVTDELFSELPEKNGRRIISDNLGFIFISSKEEVIRNNSDFYNRVDIITIDKSDRDIDFAIEILKDKIESREDEGYSMEE